MSPISVVDRFAVWRERPLAACAIVAAAVAACVISLIAAPGVGGILGAALGLIAIAVAVIDARWFIIPNELTAAGFALGLVYAAATEPQRWASCMRLSPSRLCCRRFSSRHCAAP